MSNEKKSPVRELQQLATETGVDITALLRKALLVASKLGLEEFRSWIDSELKGFFNKGEVPPYRNLQAELWLENPYHGLVPVIFQDPKIDNAFCRVDVRDPLGSLKYVVDNYQPGEKQPVYPLTPQQTVFLMEQPDGLGLPPVRTISVNQIATILDVVRTCILDWALKLEKEGILGEGISFTQEEVKRAGTSTEIRIEHFQGILGNVHDSTVTQTLSMNVQKGDWSTLDKYLRSLEVADGDILELESALGAEPVLVDKNKLGQRVSGWIGKMVSKAANGAWKVGIGVASNLLASAIRAYYGMI